MDKKHFIRISNCLVGAGLYNNEVQNVIDTTGLDKMTDVEVELWLGFYERFLPLAIEYFHSAARAGLSNASQHEVFNRVIAAEAMVITTVSDRRQAQQKPTEPPSTER